MRGQGRAIEGKKPGGRFVEHEEFAGAGDGQQALLHAVQDQVQHAIGGAAAPEFGLLADYDAMPDLEDLGRAVEESLAELLEAARKAAAPARSNGGKKSTAKPRSAAANPSAQDREG